MCIFKIFSEEIPVPITDLTLISERFSEETTGSIYEEISEGMPVANSEGISGEFSEGIQ